MGSVVRRRLSIGCLSNGGARIWCDKAHHIWGGCLTDRLTNTMTMSYMQHTSGVAVVVASLVFAQCTKDQTAHTMRIGSEGGVVALDNIEVNVPAGALGDPIELAIAAVIDAPALPSEIEAVGAIYALTPHGTQFAKPVRVRMMTEAASDLFPVHAELGGAWLPVESFGAEGQIVDAFLDSFSYVAVARAAAKSGGGPVLVCGTGCPDNFHRTSASFSSAACSGPTVECSPNCGSSPYGQGFYICDDSAGDTNCPPGYRYGPGSSSFFAPPRLCDVTHCGTCMPFMTTNKHRCGALPGTTDAPECFPTNGDAGTPSAGDAGSPSPGDGGIPGARDGGMVGDCSFTPCGGDVVGSWHLSNICVQSTLVSELYCPSAEIETRGLGSGDLVFSAGGTYDVTALSYSIDATVTLPASCLAAVSPPVTDCSQLVNADLVALPQMLTSTKLRAVSCSGAVSSSCVCTTSSYETQDPAGSGTFAVSGTSLELGGSLVPYCVASGLLKLQGENGILVASP